MSRQRIETRVIAEMGVAVALAAVLSLWKVFRMPQGGSISLSMLPILFVALRHGGGIGVLTGVVYGFVRLALGAYVVHPIQFLLDYPVAFGAVGLAGYLPQVPWRAIVVACFGRYVAHTLSGVIYFGAYAPEGTPVLNYALAYNATYMIPETIIAVAAMAVLLMEGVRLGRRVTPASR